MSHEIQGNHQKDYKVHSKTFLDSQLLSYIHLNLYFIKLTTACEVGNIYPQFIKEDAKAQVENTRWLMRDVKYQNPGLLTKPSAL